MTEQPADIPADQLAALIRDMPSGNFGRSPYEIEIVCGALRSAYRVGYAAALGYEVTIDDLSDRIHIGDRPDTENQLRLQLDALRTELADEQAAHAKTIANFEDFANALFVDALVGDLRATLRNGPHTNPRGCEKCEQTIQPDQPTIPPLPGIGLLEHVTCPPAPNLPGWTDLIDPVHDAAITWEHDPALGEPYTGPTRATIKPLDNGKD